MAVKGAREALGGRDRAQGRGEKWLTRFDPPLAWACCWCSIPPPPYSCGNPFVTFFFPSHSLGLAEFMRMLNVCMGFEDEKSMSTELNSLMLLSVFVPDV